MTGAISSIDKNKASYIGGSTTADNKSQVVLMKIANSVLCYGSFLASSNFIDGDWLFNLTYWVGKDVLPQTNIYFPGYHVDGTTQKLLSIILTSTSASLRTHSAISSGQCIQFQCSYMLPMS